MNPWVKAFLRRLLPRSIRRHRIVSGLIKNHWLYTSWYDYPSAILGYTEKALLEWFANNVKYGETWLDIGAHYGYTAIAMSMLVGKNGRVYAFEPMLNTVGYLNQTRMANDFQQMIVVPLAIGSQPGLQTNRLPVSRGMLDSTLAGAIQEDIFLSTCMDWLWPQLCQGKERIDGIKIDVQGMEFLALKGMEGLLRTYHPKLVIEFHCGVDREEVINFLEETGYSSMAIPIEPMDNEEEPQFYDDHSYVFVLTGK